MEGSVALDTFQYTMPPNRFAKFQIKMRNRKSKRIDGKKKLYDAEFINYSDKCKLPSEGNTNNGLADSPKTALQELHAYPTETKRNSPFYKFLFCPNLFASFKSIAVFREMAKEVSKHPHLRRTRTLRMLYPGSGSHLAPLDLANRLISEKKIDSATIIFTEINTDSLNETRILLQGLKSKKHKIYTNLREKTTNYFNGGSETTFSFKYLGKTIKLIFALKMSNNKYYQEKYFSASEVMVIHDPGDNRKKEHPYNLLKEFIKSIRTSNIQHSPIILMEDINATKKGVFYNTDLFPGKKKYIPIPYGHRDLLVYCHDKYYPCTTPPQGNLMGGKRYWQGGRNFWESGTPYFQSAFLFQPDISFWKNLAPAEVDTIMRAALYSTKDKVSVNLFVRTYNLGRKLEKKMPKYAKLLFESAKRVYQKLKSQEAKIALNIASLYFKNRILNVGWKTLTPPKQLIIHPGKWGGFSLGYVFGFNTLKTKGLFKDRLFSKQLVGYSFVKKEEDDVIPIYKGLYDIRKQFIGLVRETPGSTGPYIYKFEGGRLRKGNPIDFIQNQFNLVRGKFYLVLSDQNGNKIKGLIQQ